MFESRDPFIILPETEEADRLLDKADALLKRHRAPGPDTDIPVLTEQIEDVAYQMRTPEFWNACVGVCDESDYRLGGSFFDGKGQPSQVSAVSHGSATARFNEINVINTARSLG